MTSHPADPPAKVRPVVLRRRELLAAVGGAAVAGAVAGCSEPRREDRAGAPPPAQTSATTNGIPPAASPADNFLYLSYLLTGYDGVLTADPALTQTYMNALEPPPSGVASLADLYAMTGIGTNATVTNLDQLQQRGVFDRADTRALADRILTHWFTGVVDGSRGQSVATYTDALAWKTLSFTGAPGSCAGVLGFWSKAP
jgi:hypothetical protein